MEPSREPSPEKQLLKLIEDSEPGKTKKGLVGRRGSSFLSLGAFKGRWSFFRNRLKGFTGFKKESFDIKKINFYLKICVVTLITYFTISFSISAFRLEKMSTISLDAEITEDVVAAEIPKPLKKLSYYLEKVRGADIFNPSWVDTETGQSDSEAKRVAVSEMQKIAENFKLTGISWSDDPDVMIEDVEMGKIYFLKKGEMIGDMKIETILKNKVILSYKGKEIILK